MKGFAKRVFITFAVMLVMCMSAVLTVSAEQALIESISVESISVIEKYDGYETIENGKSYFYYNTVYIPAVTVTYKDGSVEATDFWELELMYDTQTVITDGQSSSSPWSKGKHTVQYDFMGFQGEYEVEVIESPVKSVTVENFELFYMADGYTDEEFTGSSAFWYDSEPREMTVTFKDGTVLSGSAEGIYELTGYLVDVTDNQNKTPWGIGRYKCTANFLGATANYYVTVKETQVKKLEAEGVTLYEGIDGFRVEDDWSGEEAGGSYYYYAEPEKLTVYYKDGSALAGSVEEIRKATGYEVSYYMGQLNKGSNSVKATYMGAATKFTATVKDYPIKKLELVKGPDKALYYSGELLDLSGAVVRVYYTDGRSEDVKLENDGSDMSYMNVRLEKIGKTAQIFSREIISHWDYSFDIEIFESSVNVEVSVRDEIIEGIELLKDEYNLPYLRASFADGTVTKVNIIDFITSDMAMLEEDGYCEAILVTDIGTFEVVVEKNEKGYALSFYNMADSTEGMTNYCQDINWAYSVMAERAEIIYNSYNGVDAYKGLVATDNIDLLLSLAAFGSDAGRPKEIHTGYSVYTATEIQKSVKDFFALDGIDISCSKNYNSRTNTVKIYDVKYDEFYGFDEKVCRPVTYSFADGYFTAEYIFSDGKKMTVASDSMGRVASYKVIDAVIHKHIMVTVAGTPATYTKTGLSDGVICSTCGEILTEQKITDKLVLGRTSKITATQTTSSIKLSWNKVAGATGYEVFYKTDSSSWKNASTTTDTTVSFKNLPAGKKYTFAVKAYVIENTKVVKAASYTQFETATTPKAPSKVVSKQNNNAIQLIWEKVSGVTGYKIYYKTATGWASPGQTANNVATFGSLAAGSKFTFAVRSFIITADCVVMGEYVIYTAATNPSAPTVKAVSSAKGKITLNFNSVRGAEAYQLYYKKGNGSYKLYKNYASSGTLNFASLESGATYTFVVRAATKTSGGWIFSPYTPVSVKVK